MIRAVVDANVIISGLFWGGLPRQVYQAGVEKRFELFASPALINELKSVLSRDKFHANFASIRNNSQTFLSEYLKVTTLVEPADVPLDAVRDPKDRAVLACAVGGKADVIVSGDKDLLVLNPYQNIAILNAESFLKRLTGE